MGTLNTEVLTSDLDFLIKETGKEFVGVTPAAITDLVFLGAFNSLDEGYDVMVSGNEVTIDAQIILNGSGYSTLPTKGAVLQDRDGNKFKVLDITREDYGPGYVLKVMAQYQRG
jgi:hypothetical protein